MVERKGELHYLRRFRAIPSKTLVPIITNGSAKGSRIQTDEANSAYGALDMATAISMSGS